MGVVYSCKYTFFFSLKVLGNSCRKFSHIVIVFHRKELCVENKILLILINELSTLFNPFHFRTSFLDRITSSYNNLRGQTLTVGEEF